MCSVAAKASQARGFYRLMPGLWQRCLWVATSRKEETVVDRNFGTGRRAMLISIAPYADGLIICRSIEATDLMETPEIA
jgi:hypothetical protein